MPEDTNQVESPESVQTTELSEKDLEQVAGGGITQTVTAQFGIQKDKMRNSL